MVEKKTAEIGCYSVLIIKQACGSKPINTVNDLHNKSNPVLINQNEMDLCSLIQSQLHPRTVILYVHNALCLIC